MAKTLKPLQIVSYLSTATDKPATFENYVLYIESDTGIIRYNGKLWYAGGGVSSFKTIASGKTLSLEITLTNGQKVTNPLFTVADTASASLSLDSNKNLTADVKKSATVGNIFGFAADGTLILLRETYTGSTGELKLEYSNDGTTWNTISTNNIPFDSVFTSALFVKTQAEWDSNPNGKAKYGNAIITEPSLVITVMTKSTPPAYVNSVIPAKGLFLFYSFSSTDKSVNITETKDPTGTEINEDLSIAVSAEQANSNVLVERKTDGLKFSTTMTVIE